jgi:hypothetical protein
VNRIAFEEPRSAVAATTNIIIRDALESDLSAIIDIYNATVPTRMVTAELEPTTVAARLPWFREHSSNQYPFWVAESDVVYWNKQSLAGRRLKSLRWSDSSLPIMNRA